MQNFLMRLTLLALILGFTHLSAGTTDPQPTRTTTDSMTVAQLEQAGDQARAQKDYDQALKYFDAALRKDSKNAVLLNKMGLAELKNNNLQAAREYFRKAAKRNPKMVEALNNVGAVEYMQRNFGAAAKQFKRAVALEETRATFHVNLGAAWFAQNKLEQAVAEYARALELDPDALSNNAKTGIVAQISNLEERAKYSYMLAKIYAKRGDADHCLECLRIAKEEGYRDMLNVYRDEEFAGLRQDKRLAVIVPPPVK